MTTLPLRSIKTIKLTLQSTIILTKSRYWQNVFPS